MSGGASTPIPGSDQIPRKLSSWQRRPTLENVLKIRHFHQYVRYCVDDLKAFYYEARMAQRPDGADHDIHDWFWSNTATGALCMALAKKMRNDDDEAAKAVAFGIAR
ncbi:MAG: hypothetical protein Ct9H300mP11_15180 [Chloroflexota bacterium]|nr:MAG: hypothetical protein Ct9H300mP11_15180 [Chloroflexota bacterium]